MGVLEKIASLGIGEVLSGMGSLAKDFRIAFTGDLPPEKKAEVETKLIELDVLLAQLNTKTQELQSQVIIAEAQGESWLQRNWRPMLMCAFGLIVVNNYVLNPWLSALFSISVIMEIPPDMWGLLKLGVGGYIISRGAEKGIKHWKNNSKK